MEATAAVAAGSAGGPGYVHPARAATRVTASVGLMIFMFPQGTSLDAAPLRASVFTRGNHSSYDLRFIGAHMRA